MGEVGEKCLPVRVCQRVGRLSRRLGIHPRLGKSSLPYHPLSHLLLTTTNLSVDIPRLPPMRPRIPHKHCRLHKTPPNIPRQQPQSRFGHHLPRPRHLGRIVDTRDMPDFVGDCQ